ncbi:invasion associated locus B family protein [Aestuariivita sp.]|jgi:invasion protein IalB|uniref:invasion associated locus B family protein n=1 Tax=Aestuariivita sp. TaxID=1872407 RepID=UPI0021739D53|nr:invasion associated locus B family protein [Aestuariivita sp.]MCE8007796.1 invasion associated locus B family protein [Aestuariivita sp.]|eukprot:TRINITY_DN116965_c0_g1_i1.p1 TRINITY_DN116965_c0_g1~~TRINITY_DN116965_c0_g1_i1.p1  ORF type:complete len:202 (+),score=6.48 TRINITY_DN116965_c0_g1_i1:62-667(+)
MLKHLIPLSTITLLALAAPLAAQDTTEQDTSDSGAAAQLDLGQPVGDGPQLGERYSKEQFGDWDLACIKTNAEEDPCSMLQVLSDDQGNPTAEVSIFRLEGGGQAVAGGTIVVPLETLLTAQVTVAVDGGSGKRYNFSFCNPLGCIAQVGFTEEDITAFRRGNAATLTIVPAPAPDQLVQLPMSLTGFTAAYDAVDVVPAN